MLIVAEEAHKTDTGRQRHANEDSYFARAAGVRGRRRDGRRAGGGGRLPDRGGRVRAPAAGGRGDPGRGAAGGDRPDGKQGDPPARPGGFLPSRHGHDADRGDAPRRRGLSRPRRRQPRVPLPRRRAQAPDEGPLAGRGAPPPGPAHRGAGRGAPAALDHHACPGPGAERERRHDDLPGPRRRRLPALQRRADHDGLRRRDPARSSPSRRPCEARSTSWSTRRTAAGAATTSRQSPSASRTPTPRRARRARL